MDNFNKEAFIEEVEKRPVIWNTECPEYSDRMLKKKAWTEVTEIFADPSFSNEKKIFFSMQLQRKWKNLKDTYMKEYKKIRSQPYSSNQKGSNYMYYSKLSFLQTCLQSKQTISSNDSEMMEVEQAAKATALLASMNDSLTELMEAASNLEKSNKLKLSKSHSDSTSLGFDIKKKKDRSSNKKEEIQFVHRDPNRHGHESRKKTSQRHEDDDKLFCLSLYKEIRKVPENNRLAVKIELLNVIHKAQMLPMNEYRLPYFQPHRYAMSDISLISAAPQPEQQHPQLAAFIKNELLKSGQITSSEPLATERVHRSPFQEQDSRMKVDSPVTSLGSSFSSNCSIQNDID